MPNPQKKSKAEGAYNQPIITAVKNYEASNHNTYTNIFQNPFTTNKTTIKLRKNHNCAIGVHVRLDILLLCRCRGAAGLEPKQLSLRRGGADAAVESTLLLLITLT